MTPAGLLLAGVVCAVVAFAAWLVATSLLARPIPPRTVIWAVRLADVAAYLAVAGFVAEAVGLLWYVRDVVGGR